MEKVNSQRNKVDHPKPLSNFDSVQEGRENNMNIDHYTDRLLKISEVVKIVPLARSTIWRHVAEGLFPSPVRYGRSTFWKESTIKNWMNDLTA